MKAWHLLPSVALVIGFLMINWFHDRNAALVPLSNQEYHQQAEQRTACRKARVTFFEECMKNAAPDYAHITKIDCEAQWASLRGHVFDGDPRNYIADEIDCGAIK